MIRNHAKTEQKHIETHSRNNVHVKLATNLESTSDPTGIRRAWILFQRTRHFTSREKKENGRQNSRPRDRSAVYKAYKGIQRAFTKKPYRLLAQLSPDTHLVIVH